MMFKAGDKVKHKKQGMGVGEIKRVLHDGSYQVDFGKHGVFKLHDDMLEEAGAAVDKTNDAVQHPSHYTQGKVECIVALESATAGLSGIEAVCTANAIKYLWRWKRKNGVEDLKKARVYIDYLIKHLEGEEK
jgi:hypothetical protein